MPVFNLPLAVWGSGEQWFPHPVDRAAEFLVNFLGMGKFNSIFSFLFGVGLTIQLQRAVDRNAPFVRLYLRRLAAQLLFGLAHVALLWIGDVLHVYAILGLLLLLFRRISNRTLFFLILMLLLAPVARSTYRLVTHEPRGLLEVPCYRSTGEKETGQFAYASGAIKNPKLLHLLPEVFGKPVLCRGATIAFADHLDQPLGLFGLQDSP
jgi:uncharacterized membrane protein YeiB